MKTVVATLRSYECDVVYEDDALLVIAKAPNIAVIPERFDQTAPNLYTILRAHTPNIFIVHRIDKETSGVVLFAKTESAHVSLSRAFEHREVEKTYLAIVHGVVREVEGTITLRLKEHRGKVAIHSQGKEAMTTYRLREQFQSYALVEAKPLTGRLHQIRVHLMSIGHPILCDPLYGKEQEFYLSTLKRNYRGKEKERPLLRRTALHALSLTIRHPVNGEPMTFEAALFNDMRATLQLLRKYG